MPGRIDWRSLISWRSSIVGFVLFAALGGASGFLISGADSSPVEQPIAFNHRKHVVDNEIDCSTCHIYYTEQTFSGLPGADVCSTCHSEPLGQTGEEARLVRMLNEQKPLNWNRLFRQPPHVFYSHRRHVAVAKMDCTTCHGSIGKSDRPPQKVRQLTMTNCIDCHEAKGVSTHCTACHR